MPDAGVSTTVNPTATDISKEKEPLAGSPGTLGAPGKPVVNKIPKTLSDSSPAMSMRASTGCGPSSSRCLKQAAGSTH